MTDTRTRFTAQHDAEHPPAPWVVRVRTRGWDTRTHEPIPARTYLRTEHDHWLREDAIELEPLATPIGLTAAVLRNWRELLAHEPLLIAEPQLIDADFDGYDDTEWALDEAAGRFGSVLHDISFHHCVDGGWADHSRSGPAAELGDLLDAMDGVSEAIRDAKHRLRMVRMHAGRRARQRWHANLAALKARIKNEGGHP